jgi:hypothetical protein
MNLLKTLALLLALMTANTPAHAACQGTDMKPLLSVADTVALDARLAAMPYPDGLLWQAQRGDHLIHIVGTLHMGDAMVDRLFARITPLLTNTALVLLEATPTEEQALKTAIASRPELVFITSGPTLPDLMSAPDWQRLADAATARGIPSFMAAKSQPWFLMMMLGAPPCLMAEMQSGERMGLDHQIARAATAAGIPMQALEPFDTLFRLFAGEPMDEQIRLMLLSLATPQQGEDMLATLTALYRAEAHAAAWQINRPLARLTSDLPADQIDAIFDQLTEILIDQRNRDWMKTIENTPSANTLIAVGAGHLAGEFGLLNLLDQAGYTLTRMAID